MKKILKFTLLGAVHGKQVKKITKEIECASAGQSFAGLPYSSLDFFPWYRIFNLHSDSITTIPVLVIGLFGIGLLVSVVGVIGLMMAEKSKGTYKGNWLAMIGVGIGGFLFATGGYSILE